MCGIAGIYFLKNFHDDFSHTDILKSIHHRGPDHQSFIVHNPVIFYHTRLSIIGMDEQSNQPIRFKNTLMCFNGEVFNYQSFLTEENLKSDTQVLVRLLEYEGNACLNKLNGFFAIAAYNFHSKTFFLIRDRLGIKPLFYSVDDKKIIFASEIRTLLLLKGKTELNRKAIPQYFQFGYIPGNQTIFKNIHSLPPAHFLTVNEKKEIQILPWFEFIPDRNKYSNSSAYFFNLMKDSVRLRLTADVPVGGFLSGGIDSSIVCGLASELNPHFQTFTLGFSDEPFFNENNIAQKTAEYFKTFHTSIFISNNEVFDLIPEFLQKNDQPFADSSALNIYFLCKKISGKIKVILSGDGADELFKGYKKHTGLRLASHFPILIFLKALHYGIYFLKGSRNSKSGNIIRAIHRLGNLSFNQKDNIRTLMKFYASFDLHFLNAKFTPLEIDITPHKPFHNLDEEYFADLFYVLQNDMLVKTDRFSMLNGMEIRNPFLDYRIVEFATGLDDKEKINLFDRKIFLKKTFRNFLPPHLLHLPKKGFEVPLSKWLKTLITQKEFENIFNKEKIIHQNIFNPDKIEKIRLEFMQSPDAERTFLLWAILVFQTWYDVNESWIKK